MCPQSSIATKRRTFTLARPLVDVHNGDVAAEREGHVRRVVVVRGLQPRLHSVRVVGVGREGDVLDRLVPGRASPSPASGPRSTPGRPRLPRAGSAAILRAFALIFRAAIAPAAPAVGVERLAYVPRPYGAVSVSPSSTSTSAAGMPSSSAMICAYVVSCPWPCDFVPKRAIAFPVGWIRISAESNILMPRMSKSRECPGTHHLGEARDADPHQLTAVAFLRLLLPQPARSRSSASPSGARPRSCPESYSQAVGRLVGELVGPDEILHAEVRRVLAELVRHDVGHAARPCAPPR